MIRKTPIVLILVVLPLLLFMSVEEEHHDANPMAFIAKVFNFVLLFGGLTYLLRKPITQFLEGRAADIKKTIHDAEGSHRGAVSDLERTEKRLRELSREVDELKKKSTEEGQKEKERILKKAREEGERMRQSVEQEIEMLSRAGIRALKEYAISLAAAEASERIQKRLTPEKHMLLIDDSIERLEGLYEKTRSG
jgi:F-type H+-transporting ATPase subunit b